MVRTRILILLIAAALVILLFNLPSVVVDNASKEMPSPTEDSIEATNSSENQDFSHNQDIDSEDRIRISSLKAIVQSEDNPEKTFTFADSLAELYLNYQKFDSAATYFEIAAELKKDEESWIKAGNAYYEAFTYAIDPEESKYFGLKVRECFDPVLESNPDRLDLKTKVGMTLVSSSNPMQGITMLREVLATDPENQDALYNLGILAFQTGQYPVAIDRFEKLVNANKDHVQGHFYLGLSYRETGELEKAKEQLEIVKDLDKNPEVQATVDSYLEEINN